MSTLEIKDLYASVETKDGRKQILKGVNLTVNSGETHAIMGPNGSGKSTLAYAIAGHPKYQVTSGSVTLDGEDVLAMSVDARARAGLFLAMQYPVEVPGVSVSNFLRTAMTAVRGEAPKLRDFAKEIRGAMADLQIDPAFAQRNLNEGFSGGETKRHEILQLEINKEMLKRALNVGFSGGEKKRMEILQLALLKPTLAVLDETDSGLDIDALNTVAAGVNTVAEGTDMGVLIITHYQRILHMVKPQFVHIMFEGRIVKEGGPELVETLEQKGYGWIRDEVAATA